MQNTCWLLEWKYTSTVTEGFHIGIFIRFDYVFSAKIEQPVNRQRQCSNTFKYYSLVSYLEEILVLKISFIRK